MTNPGQSGLQRNAMGVWEMVFLVIAFAAPLAASTTNIPMALGFGDGVGAPGAWLLVGLVLGLFSVGYAAMSRHITNSGAFYAYITAGLGKRLGVGAGYVALLAYTSAVILIGGFFGFFASNMLASELHISISWPVLAVAGLVAVAALGMLGVQASVRLLGVLLVIETVLLIAINVGVIVDHGPGAYTLDVFKPANVFSGAPGVAFAFVISTFLGFEATAIFGEEARDPKRSVPRATYIAIAIITVLYFVTSWSAVAALGPDAPSAAAKDPGGLVFGIAGDVLGGWAVHVLNVLIVTSLFAVLIAAHNSASRYVYSLARDRWLPGRLAAVHPRHHTPYVAGAVQIGVSLVVVIAYAIAGADPLTQLGATFVGLQALGIVGLMVLVSVAVVFYFGRQAEPVGAWTAVIAPAVSAVLLAVAGYLIVDNFGLIAGTDSKVIAALPLTLLVALVIGVVVGGNHGEPSTLDEVDPELRSRAEEPLEVMVGG